MLKVLTLPLRKEIWNPEGPFARFIASQMMILLFYLYSRGINNKSLQVAVIMYGTMVISFFYTALATMIVYDRPICKNHELNKMIFLASLLPIYLFYGYLFRI